MSEIVRIVAGLEQNDVSLIQGLTDDPEGKGQNIVELRIGSNITKEGVTSILEDIVNDIKARPAWP